MKSFRLRLRALPKEIQALARKNYRLWQRDSHHPSLHFKKVGGAFWSARVGSDFRALGRIRGDTVEWFWIGAHDEYELILSRP